MWYLLATEVVALFLLIKAVDWHANEQRRRRELHAARVVAVLQRMERDHG